MQKDLALILVVRVMVQPRPIDKLYLTLILARHYPRIVPRIVSIDFIIGALIVLTYGVVVPLLRNVPVLLASLLRHFVIES